MNLEELLRQLEMESPEEFCCFEQLAELLECQEPIAYDDFFTVLKAIPAKDLAELIQNYFADIQTGVSDDAVDFYILLSTIAQALSGLALASDEEDGRRLLSDELYRFRNWYNEPAQVSCVSNGDGICEYQSISDALALCRAEKLLNEEYDYDYSACLDYPIDEYVMSFSIDKENGMESDPDKNEDGWDDDTDECGCGHRHSSRCGHDAFDPYTDGLIDRDNPVIDERKY